MNIAKIMLPRAVTVCISAESSVGHGLDIMRGHGFAAIPVIDREGTFVGCVHDRDFLRFLLATGNDPRARDRTQVSEIMRRDYCPPLLITATDEQVVDATLKQNFVPIVDDRGCLCGIVTRRRVIAWLSGKEIPNTFDEFVETQN